MWYYTIGEEEFGPVSASELKQLVADGTVDASSDVWKEGMGDWVPATKVKGLLPKGATGSPPRRLAGNDPYAVGAGQAPSRGRGELDGQTKGFLIADIVFCSLRGLLGLAGLATLGALPENSGLVLVSCLISGALFLVGVPAAVLMLMKKPIGPILGRITIFLWVLSLIEAIVTVVVIQLPALEQQAGPNAPAGALIVGALIGGGVTMLIRLVLLFFYGRAVVSASKVINGSG